MADKAIFEIVVTDKGLKISQKNVDALGASVERTNKKVKEGAAASEDYYSKQNKGVIGTANSARSFSKLSQTIGDSNSGLVGAYAALAANAFAVSAAFTTLNNAAQATALLQGLEEQGARTGKTLTVLSSRIKELTKNSISSVEAMRATAQGSAAGINAEDMEKLTKVAYEASLALGRDVPDSLNRMIMAVTKMEPELVDELGLTTKITEASEKYARQNGLTVDSMSQLQKQQALLNAWVEQGTLKYDGLAEAVDPNPYNQLAATFDNLVKSGLGLINTFLEPFVSMLASSQAILLGFSTLFLSSIKGQIMPGLQSASKEALAAAEKNKKIAIEELDSQKTLSGGKRKAINEYIEAAKQGIATQQQYSAAEAESREREKKAADSTRLKATTIEKIQADEIKRRKDLASIQQLQTKVMMEEARARAYAASEDVNLLNAKNKLKDTLSALGNSYITTYRASQTGEKGLKGLANTATGTGKAIFAAGKVAAIGFINFLPVIGQVIAAVSILWEFVGQPIFNKLTGRTEDTIKAFDNFNEVLSTTSKKLDGLKKIEASTADASDRAIAAIKNQTATIYELADAYIAVYEARRKGEQESLKSEQTNNKRLELQKQLIEANKSGDSDTIKRIQNQQRLLNNAARLEVSNTTQAAQAFQEEASGVWLSGDAQAAAQYLDNLEKSLPTVAAAFYAAQGGAEAFNKLDTDEKLRKIAEQAGLTSGALKKIEQGFESLSKSIASINTGYTDFIKSITPTTQYDNILDKFKSFSVSLNQVNNAIKESGGTVGTSTTDLNKRVSEALTGFKGEARNIFTLDVQANLVNFEELDSKLQGLKEQQSKFNEGTDQYKTYAEQIKTVESTRTKTLDYLTPLITKQVREYKTLLSNAQVQSITAQGDLAIAQAHLNVIQKRGVITAQDVEKQMRAENAVIALQQQQLKIQKTFLEIDLKKHQNRLEEIQSTIRLLNAMRDVTVEQEKQNILAEIGNLQAKVREAGDDPNKASQVAMWTSQIATLEKARTDSATQRSALQEQEQDLLDNIAREKAGILALEKQIEAIGAMANSEAEIQAAAAKKALENAKQLKDIKRESLNITRATTIADAESFNLLNFGQNEFALQQLKINDAAKLRKVALREEWDTRKKILQVEINLAKARGNSSQVTYYTDILNAEQQRLNLSIKQVDAEARRDELQMATIKGVEEEIALRREAFDIQDKLLQAQANAIQAQVEYNAAVISLEAKRAGISNNEAIQDIKSIEAAKATYEIALNEFEVKKALITLEFMLLEAKKNQMVIELANRKRLLEEEAASLQFKVAKAETAVTEKARTEAQKPAQISSEVSEIVVTAPPKESEELGKLRTELVNAQDQAAILDKAIKSLESIDSSVFSKAINNAISALKLNLDTLKAKYEESLVPGPRVRDGFLVAFRSMEAQVEAWKKKVAEVEKFNAENPTAQIALPSLSALATDTFTSHFERIKESLKELGPEGEIVLAIGQSAINISNSFMDAFSVIGDATASTSEKIAAGLEALSSIVGAVQSILAASSNARIANIDKEIAAEQKRDGKSAESVAKIDAMEKKKDSIARKQFNTNKKLMMAQAVMSTAAGIAGVLAQSAVYGPILTPILAGMIGAMGMAQVAIISGTQYESSYTPKAATMPTSLSIGKRDASVDLAKGPNANAGGEVGYLRGSEGTGSNASNYRTVGSAYGGDLTRGYGNRGFVVGEKGPEVINPDTPITVTPANEVQGGQPLNATFNIQALDASGVQDILVSQKGNIIKMLRDAANASGQRFMEDVNVNVYTRPNVGKL